MTPEIFLIAPIDAEAATFQALLAEVLDAAPVAALLLPRGDQTEADYEALVQASLPIAQPKDCAVLLDNDPALAKALGADGVHMSTGIQALRDALELLKPDMIVGAGALHSRHDAMTKGEAGADYVFFGALTGNIDPAASEDAAWWAATFEVPAVFCNPAVTPGVADAMGCEFLALSGNFWSAPEGPRKALRTVAQKLGTLK